MPAFKEREMCSYFTIIAIKKSAIKIFEYKDFVCGQIK